MSNTVDYLLHIHTLPDDLARAIGDSKDFLWDTAQLYSKLIETKFLWKVWQIDEFGELWVEVNSIDNQGYPKFETLKIDSGTYTKVKSEPYQVLSEV